MKADIEVTSDNKREIDRVVHGLIGVEYKHCPDVWREIKTRLAQDEAGFVLALQQAWKSR